jgi:pyruvate formate lyase activating enzyme
MPEIGVAPDGGPVRGLVTNIQHFCTEDGPGIRTTVFLKFCSLRCKWCSNPETIRRDPELLYDVDKCLGKAACGRCLVPPAPEGAFYVVPGQDDRVHVNWELADECGQETAALCPTGAISIVGHLMTVEQVLADVEQDCAFYAESGGGITVSGGECLLSPEFVSALLSEAHARGMTTAIETASNVPYTSFQKVLPHVDYVYHDIKNMDSEAHKHWSGVPNDRIMSNLSRAYQDFPNTTFIARTPVIPGVNDSEANIRATLDFIRPHPNVVKYELLLYHRFGQAKYEYLGQKYELADFAPPTEESLAPLRAIIEEAFGRPGWSKVCDPRIQHPSRDCQG